MKLFFILIGSLWAITLMSLAAPPETISPIELLKELKANEKVFSKATRAKPLRLKSLEDAAPYFDKEALVKLGKAVDFKKQVVLIFAWRGSGQDRLEHVVGESFPEQVTFTYKPGRTRDLRPHVKLYALRSNVKWAVK